MAPLHVFVSSEVGSLATILDVHICNDNDLMTKGDDHIINKATGSSTY